MKEEIDSIKELLKKKQKQLANKEQKLNLIDKDLTAKEDNLYKVVEMKVSEHLSKKLNKFETDSKTILKRMKSM